MECVVVRGDESEDAEVIPRALCIDAGLVDQPEAVRQCGAEQCPKWIVHKWNKCLAQNCTAKNTGDKAEIG